MKILLANDTYYPHVNGSSYFTQRLAFYLQKNGHEVAVIAPSRRIRCEVFYHEGVRVYGIQSYPILIQSNFRFSPALIFKRRIKKALKEFKPDLVHIQGHFAISRTVLSAAIKLKIPVMGTNHFMPENLVHFLHLPRKPEEMLKKLAWTDFRRIFNKLSIITTPTHAAKNLLIQNGFTKPVVPISCGIDLERFSHKNSSDNLRKKYNIPNKPSLLYVGRLDKEKNVDAIIRALVLASKKMDLQLLVGGTGAEKEKLKKLADDLGLKSRVIFLGFVPDKDLPALYKAADCFIIAGIAELQSIVTLEALASGLPAIAVDAVALPELVHHGKNGYLFDLKDTKKLAGYMIKILSDKKLHKQMSNESLNIIKKHDIKNTLKQFENLYEKLIKESHKK
jgi:glycosyltransferase involved in cell wall biosynthesis